MLYSHDRRFWQTTALCFGGAIAVALATFVGFQLHVQPGTVVCLYLIIVVLFSMQGSFVPATVVSLLAVGCLLYYFIPPIFSFRFSDPFDGVTAFAFLATSTVITQLVSRVRLRTEQLTFTNAKLQAQIAEHKQTQESLHQARLDLARINRVMLVGQMTAAIAHEINQPLTGVVTHAGACLRWLAAQPPNMEEARETLEHIVKDGRRAAETISRIRTLVKKMPLREDRIDINEAIVEVISLSRSELERNSVELRTQLSSDLPLVASDRVQLQQVILNLIANAVEAMSDVRDRPRELIVATVAGDSRDVCVDVRDSGPGFESADLHRLFDSFYTTKPDGIGMGLSISRSIVEAHGGRLWATPNKPHGAVFRFTLPVAGTLAL